MFRSPDFSGEGKGIETFAATFHTIMLGSFVGCVKPCKELRSKNTFFELTTNGTSVKRGRRLSAKIDLIEATPATLFVVVPRFYCTLTSFTEEDRIWSPFQQSHETSFLTQKFISTQVHFSFAQNLL